ncbi:hypothetical protein [Arthrobacter sp. NPDC057009]|uniref:hypothetical protein n=1 Tax=Arthrobacter sp. NPDC057009 TaxID=3345996 RepID=UPI0036305C53
MDPHAPGRSVPLPAARLSSCIVATAVAVSAGAHSVAAAAGPAGAMGWWMAAMAAVCLTCGAPLVVGRRCAGKAAGHLLATTGAMVLIHVVLLTVPNSGAHHVTVAAAGAAVSMAHAPAMLAVMGVELLCMMAASAVLRLSRHNAAGPALPAVVP